MLYKYPSITFIAATVAKSCQHLSLRTIPVLLSLKGGSYYITVKIRPPVRQRSWQTPDNAVVLYCDIVL